MRKLHQFVLLSFAIFGLNSEPAQAAEKRDLCICQTGTAPSNEIKFFKLGCKTWSMTQRCDEKITISLDDSIEDVLADRPNVKSVKLGYVGHWSSSRETNEFIEEKVLPSIKKYKVHFDIHNSACSAMDDPYRIRSFFKKLGPEARYLHMYGYQAISTGGWDPILPGKNNFWSAVNGNSLEVQFPSCKEFELKQCMGMFQSKEEGVCYDDKKEKYVTMTCLKNTRKVTRQSANGRGTMKVNQTRFEWVQQARELFYESKPDTMARVVFFGLPGNENNSSPLHQARIELGVDEEIPSEEIRYANVQIKRSVLISRIQDLDDAEYERQYDMIANMNSEQILEKGKDIEVVIIRDEVITIPGMQAVYEKYEILGRPYPLIQAIVKNRQEGEDYIKRVNQDARYKFSDFKE
jgi:hypothetical protein